MSIVIRVVKELLLAVSLVGRSVRLFCEGTSEFFGLIFKTFSRMHLVFKNPDITISHMYTLGIESVPLVAVIALFTGSVTVMQAVYQMSGFAPMRYLGVLVCKGIITELGPVITSMVIAGRVATGIAAEVGSMKVSEQIDAMNVLRLDPIRYLIVPKTMACMVMVPVLVIFAEMLAILGSIFTVWLTIDVTMHTFLSGLRLFFNQMDLFVGIVKTVVFGAVISLTGAHFGFQTAGGAQGVGNATTKAVVSSAVLILVFDFLIALLVM